MIEAANSKTNATMLREQHPDWTLGKIGKEVGVSKQRIFAILKSAGLETKGQKGKEITLCKTCGKETERNQIACPGECREKAFYTEVNCDFCQKKIKILRKHLSRLLEKQNHVYCSNDCKHLGRKAN